MIIPFTRLRERYIGLKRLNTAEQLAAAQAATAKELAAEFGASLQAFQAYRNNEPFFETARNPLCAVEGLAGLQRTEEFAAALKAQGGGSVEGAADLDFRYLERELVPARTTGAARYSNGEDAGRFIRFDLLLAGERPILCELKLPGDNGSAYYALVQLLASLAEMAMEAQRERLARHFAGLPDPRHGRFDLYLLFYEFNFRSKPKSEILQLTGRLAEDLVVCPEVAGQVRRIAALNASWTRSGGIEFRMLFDCGGKQRSAASLP